MTKIKPKFKVAKINTTAHWSEDVKEIGKKIFSIYVCQNVIEILSQILEKLDCQRWAVYDLCQPMEGDLFLPKAGKQMVLV